MFIISVIKICKKNLSKESMSGIKCFILMIWMIDFHPLKISLTVIDESTQMLKIWMKMKLSISFLIIFCSIKIFFMNFSLNPLKTQNPRVIIESLEQCIIEEIIIIDAKRGTSITAKESL